MAAGAEYLLIQNSGHFCILDQTALFNDAALDFLQRTGA
jgi:pimeloyl-ACP methyl ester carboxylesterase